MKVEGNVDSVYSKTKSTRSGKDVTIYYGTVDGTEVNLGFKPIWEEGEYVSVEVAEKYGELQITGKAKPGSKPASAAPSKGVSSPSFKRGSFPLEPTDNQVSIIRQSSLNRAVDVTDALVNNGLFKAKTEEEYIEKIWELAYQFTDFGTGQREVKMSKDKEVKRAMMEAVNG